MDRKLINFRASRDERRTLATMARREGLNQSEMLRELIREGAQRRGLAAVGLASSLFADVLTRAPGSDKVPA